MNLRRTGVLWIGAVMVFFLPGPSAFSDDDHADHDQGIHTPTIKHKRDIESDHGKNDHIDMDREDQHGHEDHADHEGHDHMGDYDDNVLELTEAQKRGIGLSLLQAGPGSLYSDLSLMGEIRLNEDRVAHVVPRVSGVVESVAVSLGDQVEKGRSLATIESAELAESKANYLEKLRQLEIARKAYKRKKYLHKEKIASEAGWLEKEAEYLNAETALKTARRRLAVCGVTEEEIASLPKDTGRFGIYTPRAPISGTVIEKHITMGEKLDHDSEIFTIADLSELWVDLKIPSRDISQVKQGTTVVIRSSDGEKTNGTIFLIGPVVDETTRTGLARMMLNNMDGRWKPGTFVTGHVRLSAGNLPVVVSREAVQNVEGKDVVFVPEGHGFKQVTVIVGRRDRSSVEIVSGLEKGAPYVAQGAFDLKAMMITRNLGSHAGHGH